MSTFKIQNVKKTRLFGGKRYTWDRYVASKSEANAIVKQLRRQDISARVVAQPGYGQGGWNIYTRTR